MEAIRRGIRTALVELSRVEPPAEARDAIGAHLEFARLLGERTGQMHVALASARDDGP